MLDKQVGWNQRYGMGILVGKRLERHAFPNGNTDRTLETLHCGIGDNTSGRDRPYHERSKTRFS
jgi:hypothetical protein